MRIVEREQAMFNLTVDEAHTFFVGDGAWLVHNTNLCSYWGSTKAQQSGFSNRNQLSLTLSIATYDPNLIYFVRPRAEGAAYLDGVLPNKPEGSHNIWGNYKYQLGAGMRLVGVPQYSGFRGTPLGTNHIMVATSDTDMGLVIRRVSRGFELVGDSDFIQMRYDPSLQIHLPDASSSLPGNLINQLNGADTVMHGALVNGFLDGVVSYYSKGFDTYVEREIWFAFNARGFMGTNTGRGFMNQYIPGLYNHIISMPQIP